jgi:hypothetical protein
MNLKKFPLLDVVDFEMVIADVVRSEDNIYTVAFHFVKRFETKKKSSKGFILGTYIQGDSLSELYLKINTLYGIGFFNGSELSAHGNLLDHTGEIVSKIDWNDFMDVIDDQDITAEIAESAGRTLH